VLRAAIADIHDLRVKQAASFSLAPPAGKCSAVAGHVVVTDVINAQVTVPAVRGHPPRHLAAVAPDGIIDAGHVAGLLG
jgi:hypothetical protein